MYLERGFRRLIVVLTVAAVSVGLILGFTLGSWPQFIGASGVLVALLWLGFYAVRWVGQGFTARPSEEDRSLSKRTPSESKALDPDITAPMKAPMSRRKKIIWTLVWTVCVSGFALQAYLVSVERAAEEATQLAGSALVGWAVAYFVTWLGRGRTWPKEDWGSRLLRLRRDNLFLTVFALTFTLLLVSANIARQEWKPYRSAEGGFELIGPGTPTVKTTAVNTPSGAVDQHFVSFDPGGAFSFGASYIDIHPSRLDEGADTILSDVVAGVASGTDRTLLDEKEISLQGFPGREFGFRTQKGQTTRGRVYVIRGRLYMLVVNGAPGKDLSGEASRFLNSFKLMTK